MRINLIAVGKKMPKWITDGYNEYAKRMPIDFKLQLTEIMALKRYGSHLDQLIHQEGEKMLAAIPKDSIIVALDVQGEQWSTPALAQHLLKWHDQGRDLSLLVGGPEGLAPLCLERAHKKWSLSLLTFPHPLVRVIIAEQLYRAWSILSKHPYHRN